jgi:hypothetical protein
LLLSAKFFRTTLPFLFLSTTDVIVVPLTGQAVVFAPLLFFIHHLSPGG